MSIYKTKLWKLMKEKAGPDDESGFVAAVKKLCGDAVELSKTIRDVFPLYTLHDEVHICGVIGWMEKLLDTQIKNLTRDEAAMLLLAACCHDLGMSCSNEEQAKLMKKDKERFGKFLKEHPEINLSLAAVPNMKEMPEEVLRAFLRSIHHERVRDVLMGWEWPTVLNGSVDRESLIRICRSHGRPADDLRNEDFDMDDEVDLRMCAILLRLADILDFDASRAPQVVYDYCGFDDRSDAASRYSKAEWDKHLSSTGFAFKRGKAAAAVRELRYSATCKSLQVEKGIFSYLDWVEKELDDCRTVKEFCDEGWRDVLSLPYRVDRKIKNSGYLSGKFCLSMDQDRILDLFVGENLYQDPGVFVRELLQNAIDAVRTRQKMDKTLPPDWQGQINIRSWKDDEGYHWFRIEDNGTGMDQGIIEKYFLKVGSSYYASDDFKRDKEATGTDKNYTPISRFGIGILSCFMGDKRANRLEMTTKRYRENSKALRMSMHGLNGFYYVVDKEKDPDAEAMPGKRDEEKEPFRTESGTAIAVRTNLYQTGNVRSIREILERYIHYPEVPVHYEDDEGNNCDYLTKQQVMEAAHSLWASDDPEKDGVFEYQVPADEIDHAIGVHYPEPVKVVFKRFLLDELCATTDMSGYFIGAKVVAGDRPFVLRVGDKEWREKTLVLHVCMNGTNVRLEYGMYLDPDGKKVLANADAATIQWRGEQPQPVAPATVYRWKMSGRGLKEYGIDISDALKKKLPEGIFIGDDLTVGHNGVRCGRIGEGYNPCTFGPILLKDTYCPQLNVARNDREAHLPLFAALDIAVAVVNIERKGYEMGWLLDLVYRDTEHLFSEYTEYLRSKQSEWLDENLLLPIGRKYVAVKEIDQAVEDGGEYRLSPQVWDLFEQSSYEYHLALVGRLGMVWLQRHCKLSVAVGGTLAVRKKNASDSSAPPEAFPMDTFLPYEPEIAEVFRLGDYCPANQHHPLSKFLIENQPLLQERVPGLYHALLTGVRQKGGWTRPEELCSEINTMLYKIEALDLGIIIPREAYLTEADIIEI